jgi:hypothetical protein
MVVEKVHELGAGHWNFSPPSSASDKGKEEKKKKKKKKQTFYTL